MDIIVAHIFHSYTFEECRRFLGSSLRHKSLGLQEEPLPLDFRFLLDELHPAAFSLFSANFFSIFLMEILFLVMGSQRGTIVSNQKYMLKVNRELSKHVGMMRSNFVTSIFYINALAELITF